MLNIRAIVRTVMGGAGTHQRFTQDSPILPDVWALYLRHGPQYRSRLLLEPWSEVRPFEVYGCLQAHMTTPPGRTARSKAPTKAEQTKAEAAFAVTETVYNRTMVATNLTLDELIDYVIPMTGWYIGMYEAPSDRRPGAKTAKGTKAQIPTVKEMWEDVVRPEEPSYPFPQLLGLIRMAGVIGYRRLHCKKHEDLDDCGKELEACDTELEECLRDLAASSKTKADNARKHLAEVIKQGLEKGLKRTTLPTPEGRKLVYAVNRNRHAAMALKYSVKTVKGDAAQRVFNIDCTKVTWAVMDCGIDARHPAFLNRKDAKVGDKEFKEGDPRRFEYSRVVESYDFTQLRELLLGQSDKLAKHYLAGEDATPERLTEIKRRISRSQNVDWEELRPFLKVPYTNKDYKVPTDSHGTHVAGIIGANWPHENDPIVGMCPDIKLIDLRVCRDDGTSDEFIIISALQFLRHLNANAESPYILGVNMSLSIPHDITAFACGQTPVCVEAERTVSSGVVVVAAAGNFGYRRMMDEHSESIEQFCPVSITDPGNAERVITVGSTHRIEPHTYGVSFFSSRGPTGDGRNKPDILAPGEKIRAPALDDKTLALDGTSMAAPHVSGAAALLIARHVELKGRPQRIKEILCSTATDLGRERYFQGSGLVDVLRALQSV